MALISWSKQWSQQRIIRVNITSRSHCTMVHFSARKGDKILCFFSGEQEVDVELQTCVTGEGVEKIMHLPRIANVLCSISHYCSPEKCEKIEPVLQARSNGLWFSTLHWNSHQKNIPFTNFDWGTTLLISTSSRIWKHFSWAVVSRSITRGNTPSNHRLKVKDTHNT